ncbi:MAG: GTP 3',8-cyclase MoaA [Terriglobales bacterium]
MALIDSCGRRVNYLRLSVTDRCNLRCTYCMPASGVPKLCHSEILSYEDLYRIACESVALGIEKIRITGGEPLVRRGLVGFVERVASLAGVREVVLTTNGLLLKENALGLRAAGVRRLNVSLDSLKPETFAAITRGGELWRVLDGIAAAEDAGFPPVKLNMVVMRGVNDNEILDFAALTLVKPYTVRFIEYMPTAAARDWKALCVPGSEVLERIRRHYALAPLDSSELAGPAKNYSIPGSLGAIGIITPMSCHFCDNCNRIRVTASGLAKGCLFSTQGIDLKPHLRHANNDSLREILRQIVTNKPVRHELLSAGNHSFVAMSQIGG